LEKLVGSTAGYISWWSTGGATILIVLTGQISGESLGGQLCGCLLYAAAWFAVLPVAVGPFPAICLSPDYGAAIAG
jgi:hypothetical protein